jgi:hypothetical protein
MGDDGGRWRNREGRWVKRGQGGWVGEIEKGAGGAEKPAQYLQPPTTDQRRHTQRAPTHAHTHARAHTHASIARTHHVLERHDHGGSEELAGLLVEAPGLAEEREELAAQAELQKEIKAAVVAVCVVEVEDKGVVEDHHHVALVDDVVLQVVGHDVVLDQDLERVQLARVLMLDQLHPPERAAAQRALDH